MLTLLLTTTEYFMSLNPPFAPLRQDSHAGPKKSAIDRFHSLFFYVHPHRQKQGFEEPKFVPLRGPFVALFPCRSNNILIPRHTIFMADDGAS
jgi:hypothetical protein